MALYGVQEPVFGNHNGIHLPADIRNLRLVIKFSSFPCESVLRVIKLSVTSKHILAESFSTTKLTPGIVRCLQFSRI